MVTTVVLARLVVTPVACMRNSAKTEPQAKAQVCGADSQNLATLKADLFHWNLRCCVNRDRVALDFSMRPPDVRDATIRKVSSRPTSKEVVEKSSAGRDPRA